MRVWKVQSQQVVHDSARARRKNRRMCVHAPRVASPSTAYIANECLFILGRLSRSHVCFSACVLYTRLVETMHLFHVCADSERYSFDVAIITLWHCICVPLWIEPTILDDTDMYMSTGACASLYMCMGFHLIRTQTAISISLTNFRNTHLRCHKYYSLLLCATRMCGTPDWTCCLEWQCRRCEWNFITLYWLGFSAI